MSLNDDSLGIASWRIGESDRIASDRFDSRPGGGSMRITTRPAPDPLRFGGIKPIRPAMTNHAITYASVFCETPLGGFISLRFSNNVH
ncbi:hypothetical protein Taro_015524 [Colocasia esculenta]|uniref:Uncharacterized protein n=1 Tax=Colocasia esculenta TaxID=4460 RepID=A0A843UL25_COLES|nr:hypothetical protein [Colocasia esculenta]